MKNEENLNKKTTKKGGEESEGDKVCRLFPINRKRWDKMSPGEQKMWARRAKRAEELRRNPDIKLESWGD